MHQSGVGITSAGTILLLSALVFDAIAICFASQEATYITCLTLGSFMEVVSIPCFIVGGIRKGAQSMEIFNQSCAKPQTASDIRLGFSASPNGVGIALRF